MKDLCKTIKVLEIGIIFFILIFLSITIINYFYLKNTGFLLFFIITIISSFVYIIWKIYYTVMCKKTMQSTTVDLKTKETMIAALAHEIKNPLNSIKGANQYLHDKYKKNKDIKEFTKIVIEEIERLEKYLNEFLSFSRGVKLNLKKVDVLNFINGIIMIVKHNFPVEIKKIYKKKNFGEILIDPEQIKQVLVNLFINAKEAIKGKKNPRVSITLDRDKKNLYITITDNGKGIDKKDLENIFKPFFTTKKSGTGLGLAISKTIVKKHNGEIKVKSEKNKKTSFTVILPYSLKIGDANGK